MIDGNRSGKWNNIKLENIHLKNLQSYGQLSFHKSRYIRTQNALPKGNNLLTSDDIQRLD